MMFKFDLRNESSKAVSGKVVFFMNPILLQTS